MDDSESGKSATENNTQESGAKEPTLKPDPATAFQISQAVLKLEYLETLKFGNYVIYIGSIFVVLTGVFLMTAAGVAIEASTFSVNLSEYELAEAIRKVLGKKKKKNKGGDKDKDNEDEDDDVDSKKEIRKKLNLLKQTVGMLEEKIEWIKAYISGSK